MKGLTQMKTTNRMPRPPLVILAALLAAIAVAACGGSSSSTGGASSKNAAATTTTGTGSSANRAALAACLKQHGVTLPAHGARGFGFPGGARGRGPQAGGGTTTMPLTVTGSSGTATAPRGPQGGGYPGAGGGYPGAGGGFPGAGPAGGNSKFAKAFGACRKKLGITGGFGTGGFRGGAGRHFTPRFTTAELKSYVACIRRSGYPAMPEPKASSDGSFFPASVQSNAKFRAANAKCQSILLKDLHRAVPGQSTTPTTSTTSSTSSA